MWGFFFAISLFFCIFKYMKKKEGKIFTPPEVVRFMLDKVGYTPGKNVIDNSCGDGQILTEIVKINILHFQGEELKKELETHIHGVEIDPTVHEECIVNLNNLLKENGINEEIGWDIRCGDSLTIHDYDGKMDFVVDNPPYIRTKHLVSDTTGYTFMSNGMVDLYLAFFELGFNQLNESGKMIYIAPSSWYLSIAGQAMRRYIYETRHLSHIWDFCHCQVFENAQTYVSITLFDKAKRFEKICFTEATFTDGNIGFGKVFNEKYEDISINENFYFSDKNGLDTLRNVLCQGRLPKHIVAKNGYATLCDEAFIGGFEEESEYIIPIVKTSNGEESNCVYPYGKDGKPISEKTLSEKSPLAFQRLVDNREKLDKRKTTEPWYAYGRTQGLPDTFRNKYGIKHIVKSPQDMKIKKIDSGVGAYGGLYVVADEGYEKYIEKVYNEDFFNFIKLLRKYKSGGYYTFSTREFNAYASYYLKNNAS